MAELSKWEIEGLSIEERQKFLTEKILEIEDMYGKKS